MSSTIAQRTHIHIPWTTITVVLLAALAAAAVLVLINQPADVTVEIDAGGPDGPRRGRHATAARPTPRSSP